VAEADAQDTYSTHVISYETDGFIINASFKVSLHNDTPFLPTMSGGECGLAEADAQNAYSTNAISRETCSSVKFVNLY